MSRTTYDGETPEVLAARLAVPAVIVRGEVLSTMDLANALGAEGAAAGTLVLADTQRAGRGRSGRRWTSPPGGGVWCTILERIDDRRGLEVLSLRAGLRVAAALDPLAPAPIGLKWPNDLYLQGGKLGGILVETRWRGGFPEWSAIGVGINWRQAGHPGASALPATVSRVDVLMVLVPAVRSAAAARGVLTAREVAEFAARDVAAGYACREPRAGRVAGIAGDGALLIDTSAGQQRVLDGSLVLEGESP